ncbi:MAG: hypothetical protein HRU12_07405 [Phaeodactylibacter sp.]|nr:hypothetical protein [Phaeodactylibacter sp.]
MGILDGKEVKGAFDAYGKKTIKDARTRLTRQKINVTRELYNSLDYRFKQNPNSIEFEFLSSEYGDYQDKGVQGYKNNRKAPNSPYKYKKKMAKPSAILKWVTARRFQFRNNKTGRFLSYRQTSFIISRAVARDGIQETGFISIPAEKNINRLINDLGNAVQLDFDAFLDSVVKLD